MADRRHHSCRQVFLTSRRSGEVERKLSRLVGGLYHVDEISADPLPSGHTSRRWGVGIKRLDGSVAIEPDPWPPAAEEKQWIENRVEELAEIFSISVGGLSAPQNHGSEPRRPTSSMAPTGRRSIAMGFIASGILRPRPAGPDLRMLEGRRYGMSIKEMANDLAVGIRAIRRDHPRPPRIGIPLVAIDGQYDRVPVSVPVSVPASLFLIASLLPSPRCER